METQTTEDVVEIGTVSLAQCQKKLGQLTLSKDGNQHVQDPVPTNVTVRRRLFDLGEEEVRSIYAAPSNANRLS